MPTPIRVPVGFSDATPFPVVAPGVGLLVTMNHYNDLAADLYKLEVRLADFDTGATLDSWSVTAGDDPLDGSIYGVKAIGNDAYVLLKVDSLADNATNAFNYSALASWTFAKFTNFDLTAGPESNNLAIPLIPTGYTNTGNPYNLDFRAFAADYSTSQQFGIFEPTGAFTDENTNLNYVPGALTGNKAFDFSINPGLKVYMINWPVPPGTGFRLAFYVKDDFDIDSTVPGLFHLFMNNNGRVVFDWNNSQHWESPVLSPALDDGNWHSFLMEFPTSGISGPSLFINGVRIIWSLDPSPSTLNHTLPDAMIFGGFTGIMDEFIYCSQGVPDEVTLHSLMNGSYSAFFTYVHAHFPDVWLSLDEPPVINNQISGVNAVSNNISFFSRLLLRTDGTNLFLWRLAAEKASRTHLSEFAIARYAPDGTGSGDPYIFEQGQRTGSVRNGPFDFDPSDVSNIYIVDPTSFSSGNPIRINHGPYDGSQGLFYTGTVSNQVVHDLCVDPVNGDIFVSYTAFYSTTPEVPAGWLAADLGAQLVDHISSTGTHLHTWVISNTSFISRHAFSNTVGPMTAHNGTLYLTAHQAPGNSQEISTGIWKINTSTGAGIDDPAFILDVPHPFHDGIGLIHGLDFAIGS